MQKKQIVEQQHDKCYFKFKFLNVMLICLLYQDELKSFVRGITLRAYFPRSFTPRQFINDFFFRHMAK